MPTHCLPNAVLSHKPSLSLTNRHKRSIKSRGRGSIVRTYVLRSTVARMIDYGLKK